jgi:hypothetical protein
VAAVVVSVQDVAAAQDVVTVSEVDAVVSAQDVVAAVAELDAVVADLDAVVVEAPLSAVVAGDVPLSSVERPRF